MVLKRSPQAAIEVATLDDLDALDALEQACFDTDRLSRRRLRHWIQAPNGVLLVARSETALLGYGLVLLHRGTRLARLYSLAVSSEARGGGIARKLLIALEQRAAESGRIDMRLEVAEDNAGAIALYRSLGYQVFGRHPDYYEDHQTALRMQKRIRKLPEHLEHLDVPWYRQTTEFTCGPAACMMAMACLTPGLKLTRALELDIWREATTIYMTSGHGGCHPIGLALSAHRRGYQARVILNRRTPLFVDGVRSQQKKDVVTLVHKQFVAEASREGIDVRYASVTRHRIRRWISKRKLVLALISTYQMDRRKVPHWVVITAIDSECLYLHDPDPTEGEQSPIDCQNIPISHASFERMAQFGRDRVAAFVVLSPIEA